MNYGSGLWSRTPSGWRRRLWSAHLDRYVSASAPTKREAERLCRQRLGDAAADPADVTLTDQVRRWIEHRALRVSVRTVNMHHQRNAVHVRQARIGPMPLRLVEAADLQSWAMELRLAPNSKRVVIQLVRGALQMAHRDGQTASDLSHALLTPKRPASGASWLSLAEIDRLCDLAIANRRPDIVFALETGLRAAEQAAARWSDLEGDVLRVRRQAVRVMGGVTFDDVKTPRGRRSLPLSPGAMQVLATQRALIAERRLAAGQRWIAADLMFPGERGLPSIPDARRAKRFQAAHGQPLCTWHDLRHGFATRKLARREMSLFYLSRYMGHASIRTTVDIYGHLDADALRDVVAGRETA